MQVFVVRHAVAHERDRKRWPDDRLRPLTAAGNRKFRKAAGGLARLLPRNAVILTSPWLRARETAGILAAAHGGRFVECPELAGSEPTRAVFELLRLHARSALVIVGHEPALGKFVAAALGAGGARIAFKKGGAACLEFARRASPGVATLRWFATPKMLRAAR
jgi:phosphohistidine phosphatase